MSKLLILFLIFTSCLKKQVSSSFVKGSGSGTSGSASASNCSIFEKSKGSFSVVNNDYIDGEVLVSISDNFEEKTSTSRFYLNSTNETIELARNSKIDESLAGKSVRVKLKSDVSTGAGVQITSGKKEVEELSILPINSIVRTEDIRMLMIRVDFEDHKTSDNYSLVEGQRYMEMLKSYFESVSFGQIKIDIDANNDGQPDIETITRATPSDCNIDNFRGFLPLISERSLYTHYTFVVATSNKRTFCQFNGVAYVNGNVQFLPDPFVDIVFVHETGHNLGLLHSSRDVDGNGQISSQPFETYGDHSGPMGNDFNAVPHFNAPNTINLGLLDLHLFHIFDVTESGVYNLSPLSSDEKASNTKILTFNNLSKDIMISQKEKINQDDGIKNTFTGINVYERVFTGTSGSRLLSTLTSVGDSYTNPDTGMKVTVLEREFSGSKVDIQLSNSSSQTCKVNPLTMDLLELKAISDDTFEVELSVKNNNTNCSNTNFNFNISSTEAEIQSQTNYSLTTGEEMQLILVLKHLKPIDQREKMSFTLRAIESAKNSIIGSLNYNIAKDQCR